MNADTQAWTGGVWTADGCAVLASDIPTPLGRATTFIASTNIGGAGRTEMEANARIIAAAPAMYEALEEQHKAIDLLFARLIQLDPSFFPSKSGQPWEACIKGNAALKQARGESP